MEKKKWMFKGEDSILVRVSMVKKYIQTGWSLGMSPSTKKKMSKSKAGDLNPQRMYGSTHEGKIRITNGIENKTVSSSRLEYYESRGWRRGITKKKSV